MPQPIVLVIAVLLALAAPKGMAEASCGTGQAPCKVGLGEYHIMLPANPTPGPVPVVLHFHGAGGSGAGVIGNKGMMRPILERGYAVIAPNGLGREGRRGGFWSFIPGRPIRRDELAFTRQVLDDAVARFGLDRSRVLLTGFSIGGSLTWYLACQAPNEFAAYAPVAGGF